MKGRMELTKQQADFVRSSHGEVVDLSDPIYDYLTEDANIPKLAVGVISSGVKEWRLPATLTVVTTDGRNEMLAIATGDGGWRTTKEQDVIVNRAFEPEPA
jgi:hypothetical protein